MQKNLSSFDKFIRAKIYFKGNVEIKRPTKPLKPLFLYLQYVYNMLIIKYIYYIHILNENFLDKKLCD